MAYKIPQLMLVLSCAVFTGCQSEPRDSGIAHGKGASAKRVALAMDDLSAHALPKLQITSPAFADDAPIPSTYSDYGEKSSPPLRIEGVPVIAKSLLIICDDPDAAEPKPFVHWTLWNLPPTTAELRTAVPATGQVRQLMNAKQGMNSAGSVGYFGPKPPVSDPPHHYHFQVFALDIMLPVEQGAQKSAVIEAANGHVIAAGELVGTYQKAK